MNCKTFMARYSICWRHFFETKIRFGKVTFPIITVNVPFSFQLNVNSFVIDLFLVRFNESNGKYFTSFYNCQNYQTNNNEDFAIHVSCDVWVLNDDVLSILICYFDQGPSGWRRLQKEALSIDFIPFHESWTPRKFWMWYLDFNLFKQAKSVLEQTRIRLYNPMLAHYNILDEMFASFCRDNFVNVFFDHFQNQKLNSNIENYLVYKGYTNKPLIVHQFTFWFWEWMIKI